MIVFRDDRGVKVPLFGSQVHCDQEGKKVSQEGGGGREAQRDGWMERERTKGGMDGWLDGWIDG